ncbi:MAG: hypothetical protein Q7T01_05065 [bacterium]|nr:hypothetical protein [bacterium]
MRIGIDVGSSFIKAYVCGDAGSERFFMRPIAEMGMLLAGIPVRDAEAVGVVGAGFERALADHPNLRTAVPWTIIPGADPIEAEVMAQARGVQFLMRTGDEQPALPDAYVIAGIGSGVSYTAVGPHGVHRAAFGRPDGGAALRHAWDAYADSLLPLEFPAFPHGADGDLIAGTADLYFQDILPHLRGTLLGTFVASHFGASGRDTAGESGRSAMDMLAVGIVRDLLDSRSIAAAVARATDTPDEVRTLIGVGGAVTHFPAFATRLGAWCEQIGWELIIPRRADFAGAVGAALVP